MFLPERYRVRVSFPLVFNSERTRFYEARSLSLLSLKFFVFIWTIWLFWFVIFKWDNSTLLSLVWIFIAQYHYFFFWFLPITLYSLVDATTCLSCESSNFVWFIHLRYHGKAIFILFRVTLIVVAANLNIWYALLAFVHRIYLCLIFKPNLFLLVFTLNFSKFRH